MQDIKLPDFFNKVKYENLPPISKIIHSLSKIPDRYDFIKNGDHFWAKIYDDEINVFIKEHDEYFIAGNWEGNFQSHEFEFIEKINKPNKK